MGGYGSGGKNKYFRSVKDYSRVDSFDFYDWLCGDKHLHCHEFVEYAKNGILLEYYPQKRKAYYQCYNAYFQLEYEVVRNMNTLSFRMYFHCPICARRCRYLYKIPEEGIECRTCGRLHYESQQTSGIDKIRLQIRRILKVNFKWDDYKLREVNELQIPIEILEKPRYMHWDKYEKYRDRIEKLQKQACEIWFKRMSAGLGEQFFIDLEFNSD